MPKYTNATRRKKCEACDEYYSDDETTGSGFCPECDSHKLRCKECDKWFVAKSEEQEDLGLCQDCSEAKAYAQAEMMAENEAMETYYENKQKMKESVK